MSSGDTISFLPSAVSTRYPISLCIFFTCIYAIYLPNCIIRPQRTSYFFVSLTFKMALKNIKQTRQVINTYELTTTFYSEIKIVFSLSFPKDTMDRVDTLQYILHILKRRHTFEAQMQRVLFVGLSVVHTSTELSEFCVKLRGRYVGGQDKCDNLPLKEIQSCKDTCMCPYLLDLAGSGLVRHA